MTPSLNRVRLRLRALFHRRHDRELRDELRLHLELLEDEYKSAGMSPQEAYTAARKRFGNATRLQEESHDLFVFWILDDIRRDIRFTVHSLRRSPGFAVTAVLILTLGIGACVAAFSGVKAIILDPLPFPQPDQLVILNRVQNGEKDPSFSITDFNNYRQQAQAFSTLAAWMGDYVTRDDDGPAAVVEFEEIYGDYLGMLGVKPVLGRFFQESTALPDGTTPAVVSHAYWKTVWGGSNDVIGRRIRLEGHSPFTVVGVTPESFRFSMGNLPALWIPITSEKLNDGALHSYFIYGRLRTGQTIATAQAEMDVISARLAAEFPDSYRGVTVHVTPLHDEVVFPAVKRRITIFAVAIGMVFFIGILNLINLQASRVFQRQRELAVRAALGASRWRLVRQMIVEGLVLTSVGTASGCVLAYWFRDLAVASLPASLFLPRTENIAVDMSAVLFASGLALFSGVFIGIVPALRASRGRLQADLANGVFGVVVRRTDVWFRNLLTFTETSLAVVLLIGAGILIDDFGQLLSVDYGFEPRNIHTARVLLPKRYSGSDSRDLFFAELKKQVVSLPGVEGVSVSNNLPLNGLFRTGVQAVGHSRNVHSEIRESSPDYADLLHLPILVGRWLREDDIVQRAPVAVVSASLAQKLFPGMNPLGQKLRVHQSPVLTVVGVAGDVTQQPRRSADPTLYAPYTADVLGPKPLDVSRILAVKVSAGSKLELEQLIHRTEPDASVDERSMEDALGSWVERERFQTTLASVFAGVAGVLAMLGIYSVVALWTGQRTREIGLRMALGAQPRRVAFQVLWQGAAPAVMGLAAGFAASSLLTNVLQNYLSKIKATESSSYAVVMACALILVLLASWLPARRAARDPIAALHHE
jgi:predicted permease